VLAEAVAARRREADVLGLGRRAVDKRRARELVPVARRDTGHRPALELVGAQTVDHEPNLTHVDAVVGDEPLLQLLGRVAGRCAHGAIADVRPRRVGHGLEALAVALGHQRLARDVVDEDFVAVGADDVRIDLAVVLGRDEARRRAELLLLVARRKRARARRDDGAEVDVVGLVHLDGAVARGREDEALQVVALGMVAKANAEVAGRRAHLEERLEDPTRGPGKGLGAGVRRVGELLVARAGRKLRGGGREDRGNGEEALHVVANQK
ncbi:hypothetical protein SPRG_20534, partial [Saprolegnia parasitica CBS 223.65]